MWAISSIGSKRAMITFMREKDLKKYTRQRLIYNELLNDTLKSIKKEEFIKARIELSEVTRLFENADERCIAAKLFEIGFVIQQHGRENRQDVKAMARVFKAHKETPGEE